jgi:hypothetical protein
VPIRRRSTTSTTRAQRARLHRALPSRDQLGSSFQHPVDRRPERPRGPFERLAERASFFASSLVFFGACFSVVLLWAGGLVLGASTRFETTLVGLMAAMTLLLVALLKNAELRSERAIQRKLDAIAASLLEDKRGDAQDAEQQLEGAIGVHEQL